MSVVPLSIIFWRGVKPSKGTHDLQPTVHIVGSLGFIDCNLSVLQLAYDLFDLTKTLRVLVSFLLKICVRVLFDLLYLFRADTHACQRGSKKEKKKKKR